jgi:two-component system, chemotaxis family, protein-glutamate methylesterase/glutaminase
MPLERRAATTVVVVGGSAGALGAVRTILSTLPAGLNAAVLVALHTSPEGPRQTAEILQRATALTVAYPLGLEPLLSGRVYVALPGHHLQIAGRCAEVTQQAPEHHTRPAIDVLFRTAARDFERQVIAIVLSGSGSDGSAGVAAVQARGGVVIVQSPDDARFASMPRHALEVINADSVLPAALIGGEVQRVLEKFAHGRALVTAPRVTIPQ